MYTLINAGTLSGTFSNISVPAGYTFTPSYLPAQLDVSLNVVGLAANIGSAAAAFTNGTVRELEKIKLFELKPEQVAQQDDAAQDPEDLMCRP